MAQANIILKLVDIVSAPLKKIGAVNDVVLNKMIGKQADFDKATVKVKNTIGELSTKIESLKNRRLTLIDEAEIRRTNAEIRKMSDELKRLENLPPKGFFNNMGGIKSQLSGLGTVVAGVFAVDKIISFGSELINITANVQGLKNAINITSGSTEKGAANWQFLEKMSNKLGVSLLDTAEGYKTLSGSTMGTALAGAKTNEMFENIGNASARMGINVENQKGVFLALGQMMSKGKVSAEELNGQLGERMPGALGIAAKAMGKTKAELLDMMQKGQLMSEDFLPKFAAEMKKSFGSDEPIDTLRANMNRAKNSTLNIMMKMGNKLEPIFNNMFKGLIVAGQAMVPILRAVYHGFAIMYHWASENKLLLKTLGIVMGGVVLAYVAYNAVQLLTTGILAGLTLAEKIRFGWMLLTEKVTLAATLAQWKLNFAFLASPIGWVVVGVTALVAGFYYLWNASEKTRGVIMGLWGVLKNFGLIVWEIAKAMGNLFIGDIGGVGKNLSKITELGKNFGKAYAEGVAEGKKSFREDKKVKAASANTKAKASTDNVETTKIENLTNKTSTVEETGSKQSRIVNVRIDQIKVDVKAMVNAAEVNMEDLGNKVASIIVGSVHDAELIISNQ